MEETVFREIAELARKGSGQHIPPTKSYLVEARLSSILRREGLSSVEDLVAILNARPDSKLSTEIAAALTSKRTRFFSERGALERLSPILMTALSSGLALLPLVFRAGHPGSEILTPMAIVILCGLVPSTVLNLVVVPVLYLKFGRPLAERAGRAGEEQ